MSAYSMTGRAFDVPPMPPFPLRFQWEWQIDREMLSRAVNAVYKNYEDLNFGPLSWAYWHAVSLTLQVSIMGRPLSLSNVYTWRQREPRLSDHWSTP
jgi:hypothetical protein